MCIYICTYSYNPWPLRVDVVVAGEVPPPLGRRLRQELLLRKSKDLSLSLSLYIYIYREREIGREIHR